MKRLSSREKGSMLLIALAALALLSLYAVVFFTSMSTERSIASSYVTGVKAENVAKAGIERAVADIKQALLYDPSNPNNFRARSWDNLDDPWRYPSTSLASNLSLEQVTSKDQLSFPNSPQGGLLDRPNGKYAYSGSLGPVAKNVEGIYRLKILDCNSMIYINAANKVNLKRILTNLFEKLPVPGTKSPAQWADLLVNIRPPEGFKTKKQVRELLKSEGDAGKQFFKVIENYVTCYAWLDERQIVPLNATPACTDNPPTSNPNGLYIKFEPRAPININTASYEVLYAILKDLAAENSKEGRTTINDSLADTIAKAIVEARKNSKLFGNLYQFYSWLLGILDSSYGLAPNQKVNLSEKQAALVMAAFNPNVMVNKYNRDVNLRWWNGKAVFLYDKTDLEVYSTEICFHSMGYFEITSLGLLVSNKGNLEGSAKVQTIAKVFEVYRDTTQADFENNRKAFEVNDPYGRPLRHVGVVSLPEYSNSRKWAYPNNDEKELRPINNMCNFDGRLMINGLIQLWIQPTDFAMGFIRNTSVQGNAYTGTLDVVLMANNTKTGKLKPENWGSSSPTAKSQNMMETIFNPGATPKAGSGRHEPFFIGGDLNTYGVMINDERGRYYIFEGRNMPLKRGLIQFWVQPQKGSNELAEGEKEYYFTWGTIDTPFIEIYREKEAGRDYICARFLLTWTLGLRSSSSYFSNVVESAAHNSTYGIDPNPEPIKYPIPTSRPWKAGEWHYIIVTYGRFGYNGKDCSEGRLYVDDPDRGAMVIAPFIAPFATTSFGNIVKAVTFDNGTIEITKNQVRNVNMVVNKKDPDTGKPIKDEKYTVTTPYSDNPAYQVGDNYPYSDGSPGIVTDQGTVDNKQIVTQSVDIGSDTKIYIGAQPSIFGVSNFANATIDNIIVSGTSLINNSQFILGEDRPGIGDTHRNYNYPAPSRYTPPRTGSHGSRTLSLYPSYGTIYRKRLFALEKQNVTLGYVTWTVYPNNFGGLANAALEVGGTRIEKPNLAKDYKEGSGFNLEGKQVQSGNRVFYELNLEVSSSTTVLNKALNTSPVLDDITFTYFPGVDFLAYYKFEN